MKMDNTSVATGDWVYSESPGIWRVERILQDIQKLRFSLQDRKRVDRRRLVLCKRIVDESWRPTFSAEVVSDAFVHPLPGDDLRRLDEYVASNQQVLKEFEAFEPTMNDHVMDLPLNVPASVGRQGIQRLIEEVFAGIADGGVTNDEILQRIAQSDLERYATRTIRNATMRFFSKGHEIRHNEYVFREVQLLMV